MGQAAASKTPPRQPEIFDVTIRDGSYAVDFAFNPDDLKLLYPALESAGMRYIEVGHGFGLNASGVKGRAAATDDQYLAAAAGCRTTSRFGAFFIPGIGEKPHLDNARRNFGMDFVRIGSNADQIENTLDYLEHAKALGYEAMVNLMKSYLIDPGELGRKARILAEHGADAVYVVDSAGGMIPSQVRDYFTAIADNTDVRSGFHAHNNLELALANSLVAIDCGCTLVDCSVGGLGRSAGNTRTELMIPALRLLGYEAPYDYARVLSIWRTCILPVMRPMAPSATDILCGYSLVHSEGLSPLVEVAQAHGLALDELLEAMAWAGRVENRRAAPQELAREVAARRQAAPAPASVPAPAPPGEAAGLLRISHEAQGAGRIRNTFKTLDQVLAAVSSLASKATLPVVMLAGIESYPPDESYVAAEYLYHDKDFIVLRALFSSAEVFAQTMRSHKGRVDILVFEGVSATVRRQLEASRDGWWFGQVVLYSKASLLYVSALFPALYHLAQAHGAASALLAGATVESLAGAVPADLGWLALHGVSPAAAFPGRAATVALNALAAQQGQAEDALFDMLVLISPLGAPETAALVRQVAEGGLVVDCCHPCQNIGPEVLAGRTLMRLPLRQGLTGAIANLLTLCAGQAEVRRS